MSAEMTVIEKLFACVAVLGLTLLSAAGDAQARTDEPDSGRAMPVECPIAVPDTVEVECGILVVPENHDAGDGPSVRLPYIVLHARTATPEPDPVVFTAGGPGYSSLSSVWTFASSPILERRDVIVFEQRGNRYASPALTCETSVWIAEVPGSTPCLDDFVAQGIDLSQYTANAIARDLVALRLALGYEQWNLYGGSFSTSLMLLVMDADRVGTRSAILHSVKPPNETTFAHESDSPLRAIEQVFAECAADASCAEAYPRLEERFLALIRRLNQNPVDVEVTSADGEAVPIEMDGDRFIDWIMVDHLYGPAFPDFGASYLPLLIDKVEGGEIALLEPAARRFWSGVIDDSNWAWGLMLAVNCQQDLPAAGDSLSSSDAAARETLDGFARQTSQREICAAWDLPPRPPASADYIRSEVPTLVLAGSFDPVTPPQWSRSTADNLINSIYAEFPGHGHDVTADNSCAPTLEVEFLDNPGSTLDTSCVGTTSGPTFVLPDDIYYAPKLASSGDDVSIGAPEGVAWIEALIVISLLGSSLGLILLIGLGLARVVQTSRHGQLSIETVNGASLLALFVAVSTLSLPILMGQIHDAHDSPLALGFSMGPRRDLVSATLLAWITPLAALATAALTVLTVRAWIRGAWALPLRIVATVLVAAAVPVLLLGARWDLYTMLT